MAILNPVVSKFNLTAGVAQEVYACPAGKTHAILDMTFFKQSVGADALIEVALTTKASAALLDSVDFFIDDIELVGTINSAELNKVIVGTGERVYIRVISGPNCSVRVSGVEENNPVILNAGRLAAMSVPGTGQVEVFNNNTPNTAYSNVSITIFNTSSSDSATVNGWITTAETPATEDKVMSIVIPTQDTTIIENVMLAPGEKIIFESSQANCEYFVNGVIVKSVA